MINWKRNGPSLTSRPYRYSWPELSEDLPVDVLPCSNEEYFPPPPTGRQLAIMELASAESDRLRRKFNMTRAQFVRTAAAMSVGFWAIDMMSPGLFGNYGWAHNTETTDACDLEWDGKKGMQTLRNHPGEFIFDVQSHHVDPDGMWRVTNPAIHAFFAAVWPQSSPATGDQPGIRPDGSIRGGGAGEVDPIQNLSWVHYQKELMLDSATTATVLSCVPTSPDADNPLPLAEAARTVDTVNDLSGTKRTVMHAFVMPNRGSTGSINPGGSIPRKPIYLDQELNLMMERAHQYRHILRGWKTYCAWGSAPNVSGWYLDSDMGMAFLEQVLKVSRRFPQIPPVVATHKGFALPGFDQRGAYPRDIGPAAKAFPDVKFLVYHSGFDIGDTQRPYAGDDKATSSANKVDALIKSLRENDWDATKFKKKGHKFGNVPNVYAELGSVWRTVMNDPDQSAHLLGKLIKYVGPKRIAWGTDSLWYGSPQAEIVAMRRFEFSERAKEMYNLPHGLEGDVEDPTRKAPRPSRTIRNGILGRNAARAYRVDPFKMRREIDCDAVNGLKQNGYLSGLGTEKESAPLASHVAPGPRTRREVLKSLRETPWSP
jgi:predicted TIM-barrel fold metal-dependent hydrolase